MEIGSVAGKSLLHLQCHIGLDTLSWAQLGAETVGVDISDEAIRIAASLSEDLGFSTRFIRANIYDLPQILHHTFDIVYATHGVLC